MYADFGIFDVYDPLLDNEISGLQINIFMTPRRKRICVRIHDADIATEDLNLVWLLTEFTSNFYNDERLKNPDVLPRQKYENLNYTNELDVRVWATKPHLRVLKDSRHPGTNARPCELNLGSLS